MCIALKSALSQTGHNDFAVQVFVCEMSSCRLDSTSSLPEQPRRFSLDLVVIFVSFWIGNPQHIAMLHLSTCRLVFLPKRLHQKISEGSAGSGDVLPFQASPQSLPAASSHQSAVSKILQCKAAFSFTLCVNARYVKRCCIEDCTGICVLNMDQVLQNFCRHPRNWAVFFSPG